MGTEEGVDGAYQRKAAAEAAHAGSRFRRMLRDEIRSRQLRRDDTRSRRSRRDETAAGTAAAEAKYS